MSEEVYFTNLDWYKTHDNMGGVVGTFVFKNNMTYEEYKDIQRKMYLLLEESQQEEIDRLNRIIKQAIEYIENSMSGSWSLNEEYEVVSMNKKQILSILKGEDKE